LGWLAIVQNYPNEYQRHCEERRLRKERERRSLQWLLMSAVLIIAGVVFCALASVH